MSVILQTLLRTWANFSRSDRSQVNKQVVSFCYIMIDFMTKPTLVQIPCCSARSCTTFPVFLVHFVHMHAFLALYMLRHAKRNLPHPHIPTVAEPPRRNCLSIISVFCYQILNSVYILKGFMAEIETYSTAQHSFVDKEWWHSLPIRKFERSVTS